MKAAAMMLTMLISGATMAPLLAQGTARTPLPTRIPDAEFWRLFTTLSEKGGAFPTENFVSNEPGYQSVIPPLRQLTSRGGVYIGVGPEQNFTYIASLEPGMAFIVDIRRQNALAHLIYKVIFEASPTRAEFVAKLFSRPGARTIAATATAEQLFLATLDAPTNDSAYTANLTAILATLSRRGFTLSAEDREWIRRSYQVFRDAGPAVNYSYQSMPSGVARGTATFPSFAALQASTSVNGVNMAFLASEAAYLRVRDLHQRNMIVPIVGDFAGPSAIRGVGAYLKQYATTVKAFYVSNVEMYLWPPAKGYDRFYQSVATLPLDSTSQFIRTIPGDGSGPQVVRFNPPVLIANSVSTPSTDALGNRVTTTTYDSAGARITRVVTDSVGKTIVRLSIDSSQRMAALPPPLPTPPGSVVISALSGGTLKSGLAPMTATLSAFTAGTLTWARIVEMTTIKK
jgi:hypothetical protein